MLLRYKICIIRFITTANISAKNYFFVYNEIQENVFCAGGVKTKTVEVGVWQKMEIDDFQDVNFKWATSTRKIKTIPHMKISFSCKESLLYSLNHTHNKPTQTQKLTKNACVWIPVHTRYYCVHVGINIFTKLWGKDINQNVT